jgi:predicted PurR-regulated permease PerM
VSPRIDWRRARRFLWFSAFAGVLLFALAVVYWSLLPALLIGALYAYLLIPLVDRLERRGARRGLAALGLILTSVAIVVVAVMRIVPVLYAQGQLILRLVPAAMGNVARSWVPLVEHAVSDLGILSPTEVHRYVTSIDILDQLSDQVRSSVSGVVTTGASLAGGMVTMGLIPFVTFFLLADHGQLRARLYRLVPMDLVVPVRFVVDRVNQTLRAVIKGQVIVAGILAVLYAIGLSVVGLQSAIAIGVVAGACRVIPYFDVIVGFTLSAVVLVSDFHGWGQVLSVVLVFLVVQTIDGAFVTPRVIGDRVGLHPMVVILSVLAGAHWLGFWGVLLAIPTAAIVKALLSAGEPFYMASALYQGGAPVAAKDAEARIVTATSSTPIEAESRA